MKKFLLSLCAAAAFMSVGINDASAETKTITWDYNCVSAKSTSDTTLTSGGLDLIVTNNAGGSSDYVNNAKSEFLHWNGKSSASIRNAKFVAPKNGTITVVFRSNNTTATDRIVAAGKSVVTGAVLDDLLANENVYAAGLTNGSTNITITGEILAGDVYVYNANGGCNISKIEYTYEDDGTEPEPEPEPEPETVNVINYTASTNISFSSNVSANQELINKNILVSSVYEGLVKSNNCTIQDKYFTKYLQVRVASIDASGVYTEQTGSTPLTVKCAKNGTLTAYYRRQANSGSYVSTDGKDIHLSEAGSDAKIAGEMELGDYVSDGKGNDQAYAYATQIWKLEAGKDYLIWASGTTVQLYGLSFAPDHEVAAFSPEGFASLYLDYPAVIPAGVTAYTGSLNAEETELSLTAIDGEIIPAKTGVIIKSDAACTFEKSLAVADAIDGNCLTGTVREIDAPANAIVLGASAGVTGFYAPKAGKLGANKAYAVLSAPQAAPAVVLVVEESTGIESVAAPAAASVAYDLNGRKASAKGMRIVNGKVQFVK